MAIDLKNIYDCCHNKIAKITCQLKLFLYFLKKEYTYVMKIIMSLIILFSQSCSIFGIQNEESPRYKVISSEGNIEIREYESYIVAKTTVKGNFKESQSKAFRILASYIFGKNISDEKIPMTAPVQMEKSSQKIAMTSPVMMQQNNQFHSMTFSMPSKYTLEDLPKPIDKRITIEEVPKKLIASIQFSWFISDKRNKENAEILKNWIEKQKKFEIISEYSYAGYNPPWTIPFLRKNEVHFEIKTKD